MCGNRRQFIPGMLWLRGRVEFERPRVKAATDVARVMLCGPV